MAAENDKRACLSMLGLSEQKIKETLKNDQLTIDLQRVVSEAKKVSSGSLNQSQCKLLYQLTTRMKKQCSKYGSMLISEICHGRIVSDAQLTAALEFLLSHLTSDFHKDQFDAACGIGVVVTGEQIESAVETVIKAEQQRLIDLRYDFPINSLIPKVKCLLPWADGALVKKELDLQVCLLLGPKTMDELQGVKKSKAKISSTEEKSKHSSALPADKEESVTIEDLMKNVSFHKPGENYKTEGYVVTPNTTKLLEQHLKVTGGKVVTRFPPEPNGILHIGHAKAINIDFGYAKAHNGICYLRYDDTNPEKEEEKYFTAIREMVEWLGYEPHKITHSSDYFDKLYDLATQLIRSGHAYVCHQKTEELKGFNPPPSPWRDRPIAESLSLFQDMKNGLFEEGAATLRMKVTLEEGKVDPVAYRIKYVAHHRTGNKWCIYPTYDYTHCLCDSIENITHSLCTKEFQSRRSSYYWLCNALNLYCPVQWEFGRLNMNYSVVSKRKILKLVEANVINDWDDPRLFTLTALRRRGFPPEAINNFIAKMGLTTAQASIDPSMLEACVREVLNVTAPRHMAVLDPLKVSIVEMPKDLPSCIEVADFPQCPANVAKHRVRFSSTIYIEMSDFNEIADKNFKRLANDQPVGLKYVGLVLTIKNVVKDSRGVVQNLFVTAERLSDANKPKGFIHWVAEPTACEVRLYDHLFHHSNPEDSSQVPNGFLSDVDPNSLKVIKHAYVDHHLRSVAKPFQKFQFERLGYFSVDPDTNDQQLVFNRTVTLKEDAKRKSAAC